MAASVVLIAGFMFLRARPQIVDVVAATELLETTSEQGARTVGEPGVGRTLGAPNDEQPRALAFRATDARPATPIVVKSNTATTASSATSAPTAPTTFDATTTTTPSSVTTDSPSRRPDSKSPSTTAAPKRTTTTTQKPTTTTVAKRKPATTTTTAKPATTTTTAKPPKGGPGCKTNCKEVGFQDLSGKDGVTLENLIITNPNGRCVDLTNARNITIRNVTIRNCGTRSAVSSHYDTGLIQIKNASHITIEASLIDNMSNESFGHERNNAFQISSSQHITVKNSSIRNIHSNIGDKSNDKGNRAIKIEGTSSHITINGNTFYNAGRNAVQITRVQNAPGISITYNVIEGRSRWDSDYEDMINLYSASGTASSPIRIANNRLKNGGPSTTGTGMILGDGNHSAGVTKYIVAENNTLIDPGHVGINLAGGDYITVRNNTIVGRGDVPHKTTVGMTINDYGYTGSCSNHVVTGNRVWMDNQHLPGGVNHVWEPGTCSKNNRIENNVFGDASLR